MNVLSILVVEDDEALQNLLRRLLTREGHRVTIVGSGQEAIRVVQEIPVHVLMTDLKLPDIDGVTVLERILQIDSKVIGILMSGYGSIDCAVKAMKAGAVDFLTKPFDNEVIVASINKALEMQRRRLTVQLSRKAVREHYRLKQFVGTSEPIRRVIEFVEKVADCDSTVLIQGESGTGKELVARMLHFHGESKDRPLVPVNCGAIPENLLESELFGHEKGAFTGAAHARIGRFELAHGGTIFLDEIGELSLGLQVKLLRVLQERSFERVGGTRTIEVDVRVVAATNQDLEVAVQEKRFREDLYYRLNVIPVTVPPLRERRSDIPQLVNHFLERLNHGKQMAAAGCSPDAMARLMDYHWPGNIRELENMIERLAVLSLFLSVNAHMMVVAAIVSSYDAIPPFGARLTSALGEEVLHLSTHMFLVALKLSAPVLVAMILLNVLLAMLGRAVVQINVFVLSFPLTIAGGLLVLGLALPYSVSLFEQEFTELRDTIERLLRALGHG